MDQSKFENWNRVLRGKEIFCHRSQITKLQKQKERVAEQLQKKAAEIKQQLVEFKLLSEKLVDDIMEASVIESKEVMDGKSFEFTNFDGSVKISKDLAKITKKIPEKEEEGRLLFTQYLETRIVPDDVKAIVTELLKNPTTQAIRIITKMVPIVNDPIFEQAAYCFNDACYEADTKTYTRVYVLSDEGKYELINLSLSKI